MKPLALFDGTLAYLLFQIGSKAKGTTKTVTYTAAIYLAIGAYYNATGRIQIKDA